MKRLTAALAIALLATTAQAADVSRTVAGWTLADTGGKPGDDADRSLGIKHKVGAAEFLYHVIGRSNAASVGGFFDYPGCEGVNSATLVDFDGVTDREAAVRAAFHTLFENNGRTCKLPAGAEAAAMAGFTEAFAAVEKQRHDHPFTYPPEKDDQ